MNKIHILLPVHNRKNITQRFIKCLQQQQYLNYHLILIDDGSKDGTSNMVKRSIKNLTIITGIGNWWWAGSLQQGYLWIKNNLVNSNDTVLIINDDTEFEPNFLQQGLQILSSLPKTLLLAQCYDRDSKELIDIGTHVDWRKFEFLPAIDLSQINCLSTRGLFLKAEDFIKIGGFRPNLLPHYTSDYEFTLRAYRQGYRLTSDPSLKLWLDSSQSGLHNTKVRLSSAFRTDFSGNPIHFTIFILLACPSRWQLINILRVWVRLFRLCYIKYQ